MKYQAKQTDAVEPLFNNGHVETRHLEWLSSLWRFHKLSLLGVGEGFFLFVD